MTNQPGESEYKVTPLSLNMPIEGTQSLFWRNGYPEDEGGAIYELGPERRNLAILLYDMGRFQRAILRTHCEQLIREITEIDIAEDEAH
jgi:hypothetical protein